MKANSRAVRLATYLLAASLILCVLIFSLGPAPGSSPTVGSAEERRNEVMQIKFVRSGGFAGMPGLNVEGTIDLNAKGAKITSNSGKYQRDLAPQEVEQLRSAADPARLSQARAALALKSQKVYDGYQYDITVATQDGKIHKATFNAGGGEEANQLVPGLGNLVGWIDDEAPKIRQHRLNDR